MEIKQQRIIHMSGLKKYKIFCVSCNWHEETSSDRKLWSKNEYKCPECRSATDAIKITE